MENCDAVKLCPVFKDYLWGGDKLKREYNKKSDLQKIAESWELAVHKDGECSLENGEKLSDYIKKVPIGTNCEKFSYFPILIKLIDAKENLSVQVHPDNEYALKNEGEIGKTEMWYVLDCDEGAYLYYGFKRDITKDEYKAAIENGTLTELLNKVFVKKGDVFFIPSGTVHAIGKGIVICEIQQNSNTTYRVYDYLRRDKNGNTRTLHIDKAIEVSCLSAQGVTEKNIGDGALARCEYFTVEKLSIDGEKEIATDTLSFRTLVVAEGNGQIEANGKIISFTKGDCIFVPAQNSTLKLCGNCEIIMTYV